MTNTTTILLIPGHWLGAWAWDEVMEHLESSAHEATPLTLPGLDSADADRSTRTLEDQVAWIEQAATASAGPLMIVAHSGANAPVSVLLDRCPDLVARVVWVDSGPAAPGVAFAPDFSATPDELPLPSFDALEAQASIAELSESQLARFRERAVPEPGGVLRNVVELSNAARHHVPTTLVCTSLASAQVQALVAAEHPMFAEVGELTDVDYVDLPTGHWPMWSRPAELATIILEAAERV